MTRRLRANQLGSMTEGVIWQQLMLFFVPIWFGTLFQQLYNTADTVIVGRFVGTGVLRAVGDSRRPLYFLIAASVINIALDLVFVVVLGLGVLGVAVATILSQTISAVLVLGCLWAAEGAPWQLERGMPQINRSLLAAILRVGLPAAVQSVFYNVSNIIIQGYINSFGTNTVAAWAVLAKLDGVYWMTIQSLGLSITTFAGQNFGAGNYERLKQGARQAVAIGFLLTLIIIALLLGLGRWMFLLFTPDLAVVDVGMSMVRFLAPWYLAFLLVEILSGAMRGAGDTFVPTLITCFGVCILRVVWLMVMVPRSHTLETVMASYPITWCIASALYLIYYLQGGWLRRRIAAQNAAAKQ